MEHLQKQTIPSLARSALESFPCRVCIDGLTLKNVTDNLCKGQEPSAHCLSEQINAQDIFGKRVGIWKVLLSDVAFKNVQKLVRLGEFDVCRFDFFEFSNLGRSILFDGKQTQGSCKR
jgi:hypothetical protein